MNKVLKLFFINIIFLVSCKNEMPTQPEAKIDTNYFPIEKGFFKEFKALSINIDSASEVYDTVNYFIKELNTGLIVDASGDSVMRIERFYKDSMQHAWKSLAVWTMTIKDNNAIQMEENIKYIKIKFPIAENKIWNGNTYNRMDTLNQFNYEIIHFDQPETINELAFDSVLTIQHRFEESLIKKIDDYEKFAYGIGLVYKQQHNIESQNIWPGVDIEDRVELENSLYLEIINYGYEN